MTFKCHQKGFAKKKDQVASGRFLLQHEINNLGASKRQGKQSNTGRGIGSPSSSGPRSSQQLCGGSAGLQTSHSRLQSAGQGRRPAHDLPEVQHSADGLVLQQEAGTHVSDCLSCTCHTEACTFRNLAVRLGDLLARMSNGHHTCHCLMQYADDRTSEAASNPLHAGAHARTHHIKRTYPHRS